MLGTIGLRGLRIVCVIGVDEGERAAPRPIEVDVEADLDLAPAAVADELKNTVDYRLMAERLDALARAARFALIEAFAEAAAASLLDAWPSIEAVRLEVRKPAAVGVADHSFCRLERRRS